MCDRSATRSAGFTLVEVLISTLIIAGVTFAVVSTTNFTSRVNRVNTNRLAAKNIGQGFFERMAADTFANVGPTSAGGNYAEIDYASDPPVWLDETPRSGAEWYGRIFCTERPR